MTTETLANSIANSVLKASCAKTAIKAARNLVGAAMIGPWNVIRELREQY